jgi:hypothetical protein
MQRTLQTIESTRTGAKFAANLSKVVLCVMLLCCSGCVGRKIVIEDGFSLRENNGAPMLVPTNDQSAASGNFQTSSLVLPGRSAGATNKVGRQCTNNGEIFSIRSVSPLNTRNWIVRSPSISGWYTLAGEIDIDSQWRIFTRGLARMNENGCFPPGLSAVEIQAAIARRIPLPASEVPLFFYSEKKMGSIELAPGMEVRLQHFLPASESISGRSKGAFQAQPEDYRAAYYEVLPRHGEGVRLKLTRKVQKKSNGGSGVEGSELFSLSQQFGQTPVLRLFLEGVYGKGQVSNGILIGASNQKQLDALTDLVRQSDPAKCVNYQGTVCAEFPPGAPSVYSIVWANGHRSPYLFGTSLADLLKSLPRQEQTIALESVQVFRKLNLHQYAEIDFARTENDASELLLLPGDRIKWRH